MPLISRFATPIATALGVVLFMDVLRVWLPSLITVYGVAAQTPPERIGAFALACFATGLLAAPAAGRLGVRRVALAGAVVLAVGRLGLQATDGGKPQLYVATAALIGGVAWLVAVATAGPVGATDSYGPAPAVVAGLAASTVLHAALGTHGLAWRSGLWPWLAVVELSLAFLAAASIRPIEPFVGTPARARFWASIGPALLLSGVLTGSVARAAASSWPAALSVPLVCAAGVFAVLLAARPELAGPAPVPALVLVAAVGVSAFATTGHTDLHGLAPWYAVVAQALGAIALGGCLGRATAFPQRSGTSTRRGFAAAGGLLGFTVGAFGFYAAYDADLGVPNGIFLLLAAAAVALAANPVWRVTAPMAPGAARPIGRPRRQLAVIAALAVLAAGIGVASVLAHRPDPRPATATGTFRLVTYNIRMGFDLRGRFGPEALAQVIAAQRPDVVLLNEVDRGWFLNGGADDLALIAERLHMRYWFAPAADQVWGDAILTNLPIRSVRGVPLPDEGPTGAGAIGAVISVGGADVVVVATHLQPASGTPPIAQVRAATALVRELSAGGLPAVLAGDLNSEPGSPALAAFAGAGLADALAADRPLYTDPSDRPTQQIDHVLATSDVTARQVVVPRSTASDHLAVAVTLEVR